MLKPIISTLLLTTYLWGFGHSLIPHCQDDCKAFEEEKSIHHHNHESDKSAHESGNHDHIHHNNHVDNNWIDLYVCFLSEYEHHGGSSHPPKTDEDNDIRSFSYEYSCDCDLLSEKTYYDLSVQITASHETSKVNGINAPPLSVYLFLFTNESSFRGPPVLSC